MKFKVLVEGGREFTIKANDMETAEFVAKACLKKGESIQGIGEVKEEDGGEKKKEKEESRSGEEEEKEETSKIIEEEKAKEC